LGRLKHESIAQIYDAGMSEEGLPYFVMEYVDGKDIISFTKEKNLNISRRLNLFLQVCKAVEFAHKNLVIHRDIKPSNILIDREEKVKLTDFGIAKILNPEEDSELTQIHSQVMTPSYASPEQRKGDFINTTSDVFQLGLLLYELVSGEKAYDKEKKEYQFNFDKKLVPSEIKSIIQTATREGPEERYNTAEALLQDINNFLENRPVSTRGNQKWYVFRKFVDRNKILFTFITILSVFLVAGIILITIEKNNAEKAALQAQEQKNKAEATTDFLINTFLQANPVYSHGDTLNVYDLLETGEKNIGDLKNNPLIQANLFNTLTSIQFDLNNFAKADSLCDKAITIYHENINTEDSIELAEPYYNKAALMLIYDNNYDSALYYLKKAKSLWEKNKHENLEDLAKVNTDIANNYRKKNEFEKAIEHLKKSNQLLKEVPNAGERLATNFIILGQLKRDIGDYKKSISNFTNCLHIFDTMKDLSNIYKMISFAGLSSTYKELEFYDSALFYRKKSLKTTQETFGNNNHHMSTNYNNLSLIYLDLKMYDSAKYALQKSYEIDTSLYNQDHFNFAVYYNNLGLINLELKKYKKAEEALLKSLELRNNLFDYPHLELAVTHKNLGNLYFAIRNYDLAEKHFQKAYKTYNHFYGNEDDKTKLYKSKLQEIDSIHAGNVSNKAS
jgi:serine/threonine-protein kinase